MICVDQCSEIVSAMFTQYQDRMAVIADRDVSCFMYRNNIVKWKQPVGRGECRQTCAAMRVRSQNVVHNAIKNHRYTKYVTQLLP